MIKSLFGNLGDKTWSFCFLATFDFDVERKKESIYMYQSINM